MPAPQFLIDATQGWARIYGNGHVVSTGVIYVHLAGLLLGGGAAVAADRGTLQAARQDEAGRAAYLPRLAAVHTLVITGLAMTAVSGLLMLFADIETFWDTRVFWVKMTLVALLLANGAFIRQAEKTVRVQARLGWTQLKVASVMSVVLWFAVLLAGTILASS